MFWYKNMTPAAQQAPQIGNQTQDSERHYTPGGAAVVKEARSESLAGFTRIHDSEILLFTIPKSEPALIAITWTPDRHSASAVSA